MLDVVSIANYIIGKEFTLTVGLSLACFALTADIVPDGEVDVLDIVDIANQILLDG